MSTSHLSPLHDKQQPLDHEGGGEEAVCPLQPSGRMSLENLRAEGPWDMLMTTKSHQNAEVGRLLIFWLMREFRASSPPADSGPGVVAVL